jgi:hypothetical protein
MAVIKSPASPRISLIWAGLLALAAWLLVAAPLGPVIQRLPPNRFEFALPRVSVPYTPGADVVSAVPDLFSALALAAACLLVAELAKANLVVAVQRRIRLGLSAFVLYQITLFIDILRKHAWDWYGYILYFLRLTPLRYDQPRPEVLPLTSPWLSFLALLLCLGFCGYAYRLAPPREELR